MVTPQSLRLLPNPPNQLKLIGHIALEWQIDGQVFGGILDVDSFDDRLRSVQKAIERPVM
jgi:hypothetical protein